MPLSNKLVDWGLTGMSTLGRFHPVARRLMGEAEVKSQHDLARKTWYAQERLKWSQHLSLLLEVLPDFTSPPEDSDADDAADDEVAPPAKLPAMP